MLSDDNTPCVMCHGYGFPWHQIKWWMNEEIFDLAVEGKDEYCYQEIFDDYRSLFIAECNENGLDGEERFEEWLNMFEPEQISVFEHVTVEHKGEI